jgi:hypothetical protein
MRREGTVRISGALDRSDTISMGSNEVRMALSPDERVHRIVQNFRTGALCEAEFCANLLDAAKEIPPEPLMDLLPDDLREDVTRWMLDPACNEGYAGTAFEKLVSYLRDRKTS